MSPGRRPSRKGNPPRRAPSHTIAPIAASAAPAKTITRPSSRMGSMGLNSIQFARDRERRRQLAGQFPGLPFFGVAALDRVMARTSMRDQRHSVLWAQDPFLEMKFTFVDSRRNYGCDDQRGEVHRLYRGQK